MKMFLSNVLSCVFLVILFTVFCFASENSSNVQSVDAEYEVYSCVLNESMGKVKNFNDTVAIKEETQAIEASDVNHICIFLKKEFGELVDDSLVKEYVSVNLKTIKLDGKFSEELKVVIISNERFRNIFDNGGWPRFYSEYPNSSTICAFSKVVFNAGKTQALLYFERSFDFGKGGVGEYILLKKQDDGWVVQKRVLGKIA
jgi:hypothetical protein